MKQGEIDYLQLIGDDEATSAYDKPFSQSTCARNLIDLGMIMTFLPQPPARLLDLGCGTGWTSAFLARRGYQVTGQDIAPDMIQYAERNRTRYEAMALDFVVSDYESLQFDVPFDCAIFFDALHHAVDERAALESVYRALRPGGVLITHEPGAGHSKSAESIYAMEKYGVTEKDMPPHHIRDLCLELGYSRFEFFPNSSHTVATVYGVDMGTFERVRLPWLKRLRHLSRLFRHGKLRRGGFCMITK